ncbi:MAG: class I SAM-dependent methyltransferase, partial [bacterium]|nr:class I SAM-dependent methyltransferase [bacterium]
ADRLLWQSPFLKTLILVDHYHPGGDSKEEHFKDVWDYVAADSSEAIDDFGWVSSYTNEKFSVEEMEEYRDDVFFKIEPCIDKNSRVIELGCGHGIIMYQVAPKAGYYLGTDISPVAIEKNRQRIKREKINNIQLAVCAASGIPGLKEKNFDLIIGASIIQYFPNTLYLERVIMDSTRLLKDEGIIFLSDIPDPRKKDQLVHSILDYKKEHPDARVRTQFDDELFVGIDFFYHLQKKYPWLVSVEYSRKLGKIE